MLKPVNWRQVFTLTLCKIFWTGLSKYKARREQKNAGFTILMPLGATTGLCYNLSLSVFAQLHHRYKISEEASLSYQYSARHKLPKGLKKVASKTEVRLCLRHETTGRLAEGKNSILPLALLSMRPKLVHVFTDVLGSLFPHDHIIHQQLRFTVCLFFHKCCSLSSLLSSKWNCLQKIKHTNTWPKSPEMVESCSFNVV